ncbi:N-acetylgalactosamine-N,N'-diacetylbacillosaminyl-diphospho-undecaprenol 4-alpha-N-acetylgalactosaminyltransferase [Flavobacterium anhuiense]|uniref:Glycosyltransferase involved in cell wall bisynthesis n=1 Tax=Flavobacterium anhuiense TaxID=459526 RepID=A0AAC9CWX5_9FLAO|nr:glycosyltransferase [Flavobacterium anhuiense]AOC93556.1 N-acetylgalactosamine-N,N'-diacetylbacillosaminyl-diphospho-undecaprenol 4-alpha-N-acetylgalactosaminyltransferase [Flavobacterium anhuiense]SCY26784.1 Glycosyltransferase involved in cell wall bisynthesis [Flavobacterium anhuiense]
MNKKKVAIVSISLGKGGAERFAGLLTFMLESSGFEVHSIIVNDDIDYEYTGALFNLEKESAGSFSVFRKLKKGKLLRNYLNQNNIDIVIDSRTRNILLRELITKFIYRNSKIYYIVHSYNFKEYFPSSKFWSKILYENVQALVCVSKAIEEKINKLYELKNTITIYNPFSIEEEELKKEVLETKKVILYFGRFEEKVKNFTLMLEAFSQSKLYEKGYQLHLMGSGDDADFIQQKIKTFNLNGYVKILPFKENPFEEVREAKFTILTSYYEGFPLSVIESLALGTPVVAVDCNSGPREIIQNEFNGLLVEDHNTKDLAEAMNRFVDDAELYRFCKQNAVESVKHLSLKHISDQWKKLLNNH